MNAYIRTLLTGTCVAVAAFFTLAALLIGGYFYVAPSLPNAEELRDVRFQTPLRIYSRDGRLIQQFGEYNRTPVAYQEIPQTLIDAILAAEDDRFFEHPGFDWTGTLKAAFNFVRVGGDERVPGGSTITQQMAREYFLSREYLLVRKFKELILALQIERELTKQEILELFCNTTFFGYSSYGVATAAQTYFGKSLDELTLSEAAIIAGIPQGPSIMNPVASAENAARRRAYVLRRMYELGMITQSERRAALAEPISRQRYGYKLELEAPYLAEMVRLEMLRRFGDAAYTAGLKVKTTIDSRLQRTANRAVRSALIDYDERHGYRGPVARLDLAAVEAETAAVEDETPAGAETAVEPEWRALLADYPDVVDFETGLVLEAGETEATVFLRRAGRATIGLEAVEWAARYINEDVIGRPPEAVSDVLSRGDIVRFRRLPDGSLRLGQLPAVQGAFVALDPQDGAIVALVGGFDYFLSNFNSATLSLRQPGSAFKPFLYSAALENGFTTASIINDSPVVIESAELETVWRPENYEGRSHGETRLREALVHSYNTSAIRVILDIGPARAARHMRKFGFDEPALPRNASLALGAGGVAPVDLATGYARLANGGFGVEHYFIDRVEDADGNVLYQAAPVVVCRSRTVEVDEAQVLVPCDDGDERADESEPGEPRLVESVAELYPDVRRARRVVSAQNVYLIADMLRDVVRRGTGARAYRELPRSDIAGKTGTTNDRRDAWFAGFNGDIVATSWVGFPDNRPLGGREQGGVTAIPMWIEFMQEALRGQPENWLEQPPGIVEVRINERTGLVASGARQDTMFEKFRIGHLPEREPDPVFSDDAGDEDARRSDSGDRIF